VSTALVHPAVPAARRGPGRRSTLGGIVAFARREFRDALSSRWFMLYTIAFTVLAIAVSFISLSGVGSHGFAGFGRTAAGLLNLIMIVVPLMALTAGAGAIAGERERGTLLYLLAQPVSRTQVLLGKVAGLSAALLCSLLIGFGVSAGVLAWRAGGVGVGAYAMLVAFTAMLALSMLCAGLLISVLSRRTAVSTGLALFTWLALVFLSDLGLMAGTILFKLRVQEVFALGVLNPLQAFKMGVIVNMNASLDVLGPAGVYASQTFGDSLPWILASVLAAWTLVPLLGAILAFARRKSV
jgi:Cu-processing system permease protein